MGKMPKDGQSLTQKAHRLQKAERYVPEQSAAPTGCLRHLTRKPDCFTSPPARNAIFSARRPSRMKQGMLTTAALTFLRIKPNRTGALCVPLILQAGGLNG